MDEIERLQALGTQTGSPTPEARAKARYALMEALSAEGGAGRKPSIPLRLQRWPDGLKTERNRPRRRLLVAATVGLVATVTIASVVTLHLAGASGSGSRGAGPAGSAQVTVPSAVTLRQAVLTAASGVAGDIVYTQSSFGSSSAGVSGPAGSTENWSWPAQPQAGQRVEMRTLSLGPNGSATEDAEELFTLPASPTSSVLMDGVPSAEYTATGELIDVDYATHSWSDQKTTSVTFISPITAGLTQLVASGQWSEAGMTTLNGGHGAMELSSALTSDTGTVKQSIWVDTSSDLVIRAEFSGPIGASGSGMETTVTENFQYLGPTAANMESLQAAIPAGFTETATPPNPCTTGGCG